MIGLGYPIRNYKLKSAVRVQGKRHSCNRLKRHDHGHRSKVRQKIKSTNACGSNFFTLLSLPSDAVIGLSDKPKQMYFFWCSHTPITPFSNKLHKISGILQLFSAKGSFHVAIRCAGPGYNIHWKP